MYVVVNMYPGYAREDPGKPHLVAVVEDKEVAEKLRLVAGGDAKVFPVTLNAIPLGLVTHAQSYGIDYVEVAEAIACEHAGHGMLEP